MVDEGHAVHALTSTELDELDPGIRLTVRWLREHGFETTDSGDGVTKIAAIDAGDALGIPHVFMRSTPAAMIFEAMRLRDLLTERGVRLEPGMLQSSYDPIDGSAVICLIGVTDVMLNAGGQHG